MTEEELIQRCESLEALAGYLATRAVHFVRPDKPRQDSPVSIQLGELVDLAHRVLPGLKGTPTNETEDRWNVALERLRKNPPLADLKDLVSERSFSMEPGDAE
ncbi:hypothetical protein LCGC14_2526670 [marine sediment metagenome]|uniref:Uncharacterized protein n=1 Tax=marine sediment metagenome TaxID=412755 RepID=A0A0F9BHP4_9ZZZZ